MSSITVVQCDNVLLRPFLCIDLPLKWGTLHKFHAQVGDHHNHKYHHNRHHIDCHFQCNDRDPWLHLLHPSDGLLGSEAHPQFLPGGDYVDADVGQNYHCEGDGDPRQHPIQILSIFTVIITISVHRLFLALPASSVVSSKARRTRT